MVRLSQTLCKYIPDWYHLQKSSTSYFKKQALFHMTRYYKNIGRTTHKNAMNRYEYFLKGEQFFAAEKSRHRMDINRMRIAAACDEHGLKYGCLRTALLKIDINLNLASLARLAIYEPKSFKCLVDIAREATSDQIERENFDTKKIESENEIGLIGK